MRAIAVVNQKGGCGKTTTAINLAAFLARADRRTLVVDMDPQGHATLGLVSKADDLSATVYDALVARLAGRPASLDDVMLAVGTNLDLVPSNILLSALPEISVSVPGRETLLSGLVDAVRERYDYLIVDCPPGVGILTFNALMACTEAIVPIEPGFFSLHGIAKMLETFDLLARDAGHVVAPRALMTMYCGRTRFAREVGEEIRHHLEGRCYHTVIRHSVKLAEAASHALPIVEYCRHCVGFDDYALLCAEVLQAEEELGIVLRPVETATETPAVETATPSPKGWPPSAPQATAHGVDFPLEAPIPQTVRLADLDGWSANGAEVQPSGRARPTIVRPPVEAAAETPAVGTTTATPARKSWPPSAPQATAHGGDFPLEAPIPQTVRLGDLDGWSANSNEMQPSGRAWPKIVRRPVEVAAEASAVDTATATPAPQCWPPSAPQVTADGVVFALEAPEARTVQLAGDFNGWKVDGNEMQPAGRVWTKVVPLVPGRYCYRYVVDGRWQNDPLNSAVEPAPFGGYNSIVVVEERLANAGRSRDGAIDG